MNAYCNYSDARLLELLDTGSDPKAFSEIYDRYSERLLAVAYYHGGQRIIAEEIVQEVFIRLWEKKGEVAINDIGAYLATACKFMVFKYFAKERRRSALLGQHLPLQEQSNGVVDQEAIISALFLEEYLRGIVEKLPEKCKIIYKYNAEEGYNIRQIAQILSVSTNTVRNQLAKARKIIRTSLRHAGHFILFIF